MYHSTFAQYENRKRQTKIAKNKTGTKESKINRQKSIAVLISVTQCETVAGEEKG